MQIEKKRSSELSQAHNRQTNSKSRASSSAIEGVINSTQLSRYSCITIERKAFDSDKGNNVLTQGKTLTHYIFKGSRIIINWSSELFPRIIVRYTQLAQRETPTYPTCLMIVRAGAEAT